MRIEKEYNQLENIDEIRIYHAFKKDFYNPTPQEFYVENLHMNELVDNIPLEIYSFIPYEGGKDFIIQRVGLFTLDAFNCSQEDVKGRLLSKLSPIYFNTFHDHLVDVYKNHKPKDVRIVYYNAKNKVRRLTNTKIVYDMEKLFIINQNIDAQATTPIGKDGSRFDEDKTSMLESFSQTGNYYKVEGKYNWSQGIYNIINRTKEEPDKYYNIVFDLVIPEDQHIIDKIIDITNRETSECNETFRIKTDDDVLKVIEVNIQTYFNENGVLIRQGLVNDISQKHHYEMNKPVDFLLDGFKNSTKLALLIEPLNRRQYEFSKGFYYLIEKNYEEYNHSEEILKYIEEEDIVERLAQLIEGKITRIDETITFKVNGDPNNKKIADLYIESFRYNGRRHSIGCLTDITEEMEKQNSLIESNEQRLILIKEIHHRVKNNLQILNSFLNLEKRAYRNDPNLIIEHMQTRLTSLALLHEKTYNSKDFKNINLNEYLMDHDKQTKILAGLPTEVEFETYVDEDLNLSLEVITPLLLIIDELTMNALKHAFPDKSAPGKKIIKTITRSDDNTATLILKDTGIGIKDPKKISKNLGCEIIKSLTKQLNGNISLIETENGTSYKLVFPTEMEHTIY